jgi:hypothetical protein
MPVRTYRYAIELLNDGAAVLDRFPAEIDWAPAAEWVRFTGIRRGKLPPVLVTDPGTVEPIWHPKHGQPYLAGFEVTVLGSDGVSFSSEIPTSCLKLLARQASAAAVEKGLLKSGEWFHYRVLAFPCEAEPVQRSADAVPFSIKEVLQPLPLRTRPFGDLLQESVRSGIVSADDVPVFVPRSVLDEASVLTREAGARETGGILIGHLCQDPDSSAIFAEVTAQIPARHTHSELTKLTFTADTWAAVQAAINLRGRDELYLGWWHSHSYMKETCRDCEKRSAGTCTASASFMSSEDVALHLTCFPRAYSVALVISDSPCTGLAWELFGWRYGTVVPRGFHVLEAPRSGDRAAPARSPTGEDANVARTR